MKSLDRCVQTLVKAVGGDGNFLLGVGPTSEGLIEPHQVIRLKEMGAWLANYGESIYGTRGGPFMPGSWGASTHKGNTIYVHILSWADDTITLPPIPNRIVKSTVLTGGSARIEETSAGVEISVPKTHRRKLDTIVALELDGPAGRLPLQSLPFTSLAIGKKATASNTYDNPKPPHNDPDRAVDDDVYTRWATDSGVKQAWLEVDMGQPETFDRVRISEKHDRIRKFELQYRDGGQWKAFAEGTTIGSGYTKQLEPVTARYVRLDIQEATDGPSIWEFQLFAPKPK